MRLITTCIALGVLATAAYAAPEGADHKHDHDHAAPAAGGPLAESERQPTGKATDYFWQKSDEAFHLGDYERVLRLHKAIVALDPQDIESYGVYAWIAWSMGNNKEATDHIERGLKANPDNWEMWHAAGEQYQFMKLWPQAQTAFARAIQMAPKEENTQIMRRQLAHVAQNAGDLQTSVETWRALVKDFPNEPVNKSNLERVEKLIAEKSKASTQTSQASTGNFIMTSAGLLGAIVIPALMRRA